MGEPAPEQVETVARSVATVKLTDVYYAQPVADAIARDLGPVRSVGFTGSSETVSLVQMQVVWRLLTAIRAVNDPKRLEFHHGDCIQSDEQAADTARRAGLWVIGHPPLNPYKRAWVACDELRPRDDYLTRNGHIVTESHVLLATPKEHGEQLRSGTWATIQRARKAGLPVVLVLPGMVRVEHPAQPQLFPAAGGNDHRA